MRILKHHYLIVDLEATCSNDGTVPRHEMEIIEIGAVMLNSHSFEIESEFKSFVSPVRHPELTDFCTQLTGINQNHLKNAPPFVTALEAMTQWMGKFEDSLFCSWGDYDKNQFIQDCQYHGLAYPFQPEHLNLKAEFSRAVGVKKRFGLSAALKYCGLDFEGSHHRGLDDAKNIARVVRHVLMGTDQRAERKKIVQP